MNAHSFAYIVISAIIGVVLVTSLLIPAISSSAQTEEEDNEFTADMLHATTAMEGQVYTVADGALCYNGEAITTSALHILSDHFRAMFYSGSLVLFDATHANITVKSLTINADGSYSVVATNDTTFESTESMKWFAGPTTDADADYIGILAGNADINVNGDSKIYGGYYGNISDGETTYGNTKHILTFSGTVSDLKLNSYIYETSDWVQNSGTVTMASESDGYNVYSLTAPTVSIKVGDFETGDSTAFMLYAPVSYDVVTDSPTNQLLMVIPILVVVGLVLFVIQAAIGRRE